MTALAAVPILGLATFAVRGKNVVIGTDKTITTYAPGTVHVQTTQKASTAENDDPNAGYNQ